MEMKTKTVLKKNPTMDASAGQVAQDISEDGVEQHNTARKLHHKAFTKAMKSFSTSPNHTQAMKDQNTHAKTMKDLEKKHGLKLNQFGGAYKVKESVDLNEVKTQSMADKPDHLFKKKVVPLSKKLIKRTVDAIKKKEGPRNEEAELKPSKVKQAGMIKKYKDDTDRPKNEDKSSWHSYKQAPTRESKENLDEYGGPKQPLVPLPKKKPAVTFSPVVKDKVKYANEEVGGAKVKPNYWGSKETLEKGRADQKIKDAKHSEQMKKDKKNKTGMFAQEASCGMNPNVKEYNDKEKKMVKEDREVSMAVSQLKTMCEYGTDLIKNLEAKGPDYNIEAWVQSKITKAADYMNSVGHYMENEAKVSSDHSPEAKNEDVYDPFTKKMVKRRPMKQQMGGPALNTNRPKDDTPAPIKIKYKDQPKKMDYSNYKEDAPANASGGGAIAGVGVGPEGEPGVMLPRKKNKKDAVMGFAAFNRKNPV